MHHNDHRADEGRPLSDEPGFITTDACEKLAAKLSSRIHYRDEMLHAVRGRAYVVFYGCGRVFESVVESWMQYVGRPIDFCCDSNPAKWGKVFCGARCLSPQELLEIKDTCVVFVTVGHFRPVLEQLISSGFRAVHIVYRYDLVSSDFLDHQDVATVADNLSRARKLLGDEKSVRVFDAIVERVLGGGRDWQLMLDICEGDQYFPSDIVHLTAHEQFVDIGAFDGDTVADFVRRTEGLFERIDAFELDRINFGSLRDNIAHLPNSDHIRAFNLGIWDTERDVNYSVGKSQSTVGSGQATGHVVPLDAILERDRISFVKMDIEGAEPNALRGGQHIIATQKPALAVCVYHHFKHLWEIPLLINELVPEHAIFLRHHSPLEYETVCYAIPPEKAPRSA